MKLYYDYTCSPLGQLFYRTVGSQLSHIQGNKILDFGSGFGFTADFLAQHNEVVALELDPIMIQYASTQQHYTTIQGDLSALSHYTEGHFDVITCHLVLEFVPDPQALLQQLLYFLKPGGILSVVRHNRNGRLIQSIVQDYDIKEAHALLQGSYSYSSAFGDIKYYENEDILRWSNQTLQVEKVVGVRALASLHSAEHQSQPDWLEEMLILEKELTQKPEFIAIAYFNHLLLRKH